MNKLFIIILSSLVVSSCTATRNAWQATKTTTSNLTASVFGSGDSVEYVVSDDLDPVWRRSVGKQNDYLAPTRDADTVYVVNRSGKVHGYDLESGDEVVDFKIKVEEDVEAGLGIGNDSLYVVDANGILYSVSKRTGGLNWRKSLNVEVVVPPVTYENHVVIHSINGSLINVNALTGDVIWRYDHPQPGLTLRGGSKPIIYDDIIITGFADGSLVANDRGAGYVLWDIFLGNRNAEDDIEQLSDIDTQPFLDRNGILYVSSYQGKTAALDINNGQVVWENPVSTYRPYALTSDRMYLIDDLVKIVGINRENGDNDIQISADEETEEFVSLFQHNGNLYVLDNKGYAYQVDVNEGVLLNRTKITNKKGIAPPLYGKQGRLLLLSKKGKLIQF